MEQKLIRIANKEEGKWLVVSSCFFLGPAVYAFSKGLHEFGWLLTGCSVASANYWKDAVYGWRRNMDLCFARASFIVFVYHGIVIVQPGWKKHFSYASLFIVLFLYYLSWTNRVQGKKRWVLCHFLFHSLMTIEQFIILHDVSLYWKH